MQIEVLESAEEEDEEDQVPAGLGSLTQEASQFFWAKGPSQRPQRSTATPRKRVL